MIVILADIGGTYARFAVPAANGLQKALKLKASDFPDLAAAIRHFAASQNLPDQGKLTIATAAVPDAAGVWHFQNENRWKIDPAALAAAGWTADLIVNDFTASARGVVALPPERLITLKEGSPLSGRPCAVLGPGTGLGLAFIVPLADGRWHVQPTHGGHMLAAGVTDEQLRIMALVRQIRGAQITVPEDVASGRGLSDLYRAVCLSRGLAPEPYAPEDLLANLSDSAVADTLRLFHEFLGLFAHQAVVTGHAYGGVYIDGGLARLLYERGVFDFETFSRFLVLPVVPPVRRELEETPVYIVDEPYVALYGLKEFLDDAQSLSDH